MIDKESFEKNLKEFGIDGEAATLIRMVFESVVQEKQEEAIHNKADGLLTFSTRTSALVHWTWLAQLTPGRTVEVFLEDEWVQAVFLGLDYDNDSWPVIVGIWDEKGKTLDREYATPDNVRPISSIQ